MDTDIANGQALYGKVLISIPPKLVPVEWGRTLSLTVAKPATQSKPPSDEDSKSDDSQPESNQLDEIEVVKEIPPGSPMMTVSEKPWPSHRKQKLS